VDHLRAIRQFAILSARNLKILSRDRVSLFLMLAAAPLVGLLDFVLASGMEHNPYDYQYGDFSPIAISLFLFTIYGVLVGGLSQMREIVKEKAVYRRERLVNLQILPYVASKMWVAGLLALYQAFAYTLLHYLAFDMPGGALEFGLIYVTIALATFAGMMIGLFASALAPNSNTVPLLVILLMIPQIVIGGALIPLPGAVTAITSDDGFKIATFKIHLMDKTHLYTKTFCVGQNVAGIRLIGRIPDHAIDLYRSQSNFQGGFNPAKNLGNIPTPCNCCIAFWIKRIKTDIYPVEAGILQFHCKRTEQNSVGS